MFARLFSESGLSLDRLRALVEVGAAGSIVQAAPSDPIRQSQLSRQIKELEDFFHAPLVERAGKGIRLTANGRELARIARFALLGLSNFQRGCLAEDRTYRIGASATVLRVVVIPWLAGPQEDQPSVNYALETLSDDAIERRLHDLTLDFGIVTKPELSRPLRQETLGSWRLNLLVPKTLYGNAQACLRAFRSNQLPWVAAAGELPLAFDAVSKAREPSLICESFLEAREALAGGRVAVLLPDFLIGADAAERFHVVRAPGVSSVEFQHRFCWNPRLLRLNPQAIRRRDQLAESFRAQMRGRARVRPPSP